jgi:cell division protein ZapB
VYKPAVSIDPAIGPPYSGGMISEFQELSDKIEQLADMTQSLRRENAQLRSANAALVAENLGHQQRLAEAHQRVSALLEQIPPLDVPAPEQEDVQ